MKHACLALGLTVVAVAVVGPSARAASIGAWSGEPNGGVSAEPCYSEGGFDSVENNGMCSTSASGSWEVPLYVDGPGSYAASVSVKCPAAVTCAVYGVSATGAEQKGEAFSNVPANTSGYYQLGGTATVPSGGYLFAACWLPASCTLHAVDWELAPASGSGSSSSGGSSPPSEFCGTYGAHCCDGSICYSGACSALSGSCGGSCSLNTDCFGGLCVTGTCQ